MDMVRRGGQIRYDQRRKEQGQREENGREHEERVIESSRERKHNNIKEKGVEQR